MWRRGLKCDGRRTHLVGLSHGAVVEAEEVDELIKELADAGAGDVHGAAQSLSGIDQSTNHSINQSYFIEGFCRVAAGRLVY